MTKALNDAVDVKRDLMGLFFSYGIGYNYFNLLLPAMAVIFSYSHHTVKIVFLLLLLYCYVFASAPLIGL